MAGSDGSPSQGAAPLRATNYADVSLFARIFFTYVNPIFKLASIRPLEENDVRWLTPDSDQAHNLASSFERTYKVVKAHYAPCRSGSGIGSPPRRPWTTLTGITLLRLHWWQMLLESLWVLVEVGQRLGTPVALREFLRWLQAYVADEAPPQWQGWMWAVVLGACGFSMVIIHHQLFFIGMRLGFKMRQQTVHAIHAKVLRLNSAAVSALSSGHVVNLVSNDVRRFDDMLPYWIFLWAAPLELAMVLLMVSLELDFVSALAGVATSLAMIPLQSILVKYIGGLRRNTAHCTDERVRLAGEVVEGALAMKMLGWEDPLAESLRAIRARETYFSRRMQRIRGVNFAMQFFNTPIVSFVTFAVYRSRNGSLDLASVFYALSLLHLPKLYMVNFFVLAVQNLTELRVSLQRIDELLTTPEPTRPGQTHRWSGPGGDARANGSDPAANVHLGGTGSSTFRSSLSDGIRRSLEVVKGVVWRSKDSPPDKATAATADVHGGKPLGYVSMGSADYDWSRPFGRNDVRLHDMHGTALGSGGAATKEGDIVAAPTRGDPKVPKDDDDADAKSGNRDAKASLTIGGGGSDGDGDLGDGGLTLHGIRFTVMPGELLGIAGAVGSGKSSLLAALLGELQPLQTEKEAEREIGKEAGDCGGAIVCGRVAYCSQLPWIVAGSVRENILFGSAWDEQWYGRVIDVCCLADDLAGLPAGDQTELGERGINLSGGQKARVALARACYCRPDVALLDDPLSAVDPRVGRDLFERALGPRGLLGECNTTRLLVTHQRQFLPKCDRVLVLRGGRVGAEGTWSQLAQMSLPELTGFVSGGVSVGDCEAAAEDGDEGVTIDEALEAVAQVAEGGKTHIKPAAAAAAAAAVTSPSATSSVASSDSARSADVGLEMCDIERKRKLPPQSPPQPPPPPQNPFAPPLESEVVVGMATDTHTSPEVPGAAAKAVQELESMEEGEAQEGCMVATPTSRFWRGMSQGLGAFGDRYHLSLSCLASDKMGGKSDGGGLGLRRRRQRSRMDGKTESTDAGKLVEDEDRATGTVSWRVYGTYCRHLGLAATGMICVGLVGGQAAFLASEWWLAIWARAAPEEQGHSRWLWVFGMLTGIVIIVALLRSVIFFEATLSASTSIHNSMARRVLRAPLSFFHRNPSGRIVNRFSKDQGQVDDLLPSCLFDALQSAFQVFGAFVLVAIAVPVILPVFLPLLASFLWIRSRYIRASRDIKRWEAVTRSPIFASFSATIKGLPTIRAYGAANRFDDAFLRLMANNGDWYFAFLSTARWIGVGLDAVAAAALLATTLLAIVMRDRINMGVMALALTHVLQMTGLLQWTVRQTAEVENSMTSVERMLSYTQLPSEPPRVAEGGGAPPEGWPRSGALTYRDVTAVYRLSLPPVLHRLSFTLPAGCSCGVVGRTGSGKSSLMLTLFRLIHITGGSIFLDGVDTASIGLDALRRQLAIIPQDPVLFSGTLRSNLDPWVACDDAALWRVLEAVQLRGAVAAMAGGLDAAMAECGGNLSVGQRQLFCLARALLQDAKVLALDEATANVDRATDELIQRSLRDFARRDVESHGRVLLVIAHRIDTIMDTDQLLVLSNGQLVESGPPGQLAEREDGVFARMVVAAKLGAGGVPGKVAVVRTAPVAPEGDF